VILFEQFKQFMESTGQTTSVFNNRQGELHFQSIGETLHNATEAMFDMQDGYAEEDQGLIDRSKEGLRHQLNLTILGLMGPGYSCGVDMPEGMQRIVDQGLFPKPEERAY
jgi:hypothetical protein